MSEPGLQQQTKSLLTELSAELRHGLKQELDDLLTVVGQRTTAIERVVSNGEELFDSVSVKIQTLAAAEATRAEREHDAAAQAKMDTLRTALQSEFDASRTEFERIRTALETQLAERERDMAAIRLKRDEHATSLEQAQDRIRALEASVTQDAGRRQIAEARLEEEVQRRALVNATLEASRQEVLVARAEADSCRLEARVMGERINALEKRLTELSGAETIRIAGPSDRNVLSDYIAQTVDELSRARTDDILSLLTEHLSRLFPAIAIFGVTPDRFTLWKSVNPGIAGAPHVPLLESSSPVALACKQHRSVTETGAALETSVGLWDTPVRHVIALPILALGRVMAVAYGESPPERAEGFEHALEAVAKTFVDCVNCRLSQDTGSAKAGLEPTLRSPALADAASSAGADPFAISRRARRTKIAASVDILVDGTASRLVDVSAHGMQVVSPAALRPNRPVRIVLPSGANRVSCEGLVVWAQLESSNGQIPAAYRAGVHFLNIALEFEAFVLRQSHVPETIHH